MTPPTHQFDVDCYVRPPITGETERIVKTLRTHDCAGRLNSLTVESWPASVSLDSTVNADVVRTVERFREWASERGARLDPAFSVEEHVSVLTGVREKLLHLPTVCLAVYQDDDLFCVIPNRTDERTCTVPKALDLLETDDPAHQPTFADSVHPNSRVVL